MDQFQIDTGNTGSNFQHRTRRDKSPPILAVLYINLFLTIVTLGLCVAQEVRYQRMKAKAVEAMEEFKEAMKDSMKNIFKLN